MNGSSLVEEFPVRYALPFHLRIANQRTELGFP